MPDDGPHHKGRLTADRLIAALADLQIEFAGKTIPVPWYEADLYLCGPAAFLEQMQADLLHRGARPDRLKMEHFSPNALTGDPKAFDAPTNNAECPRAIVKFNRSGTQATWRLSENPTLLELGGSPGLDLPFSCLSGYCGSCQCRIVEGEVRYEYAPLYNPPPGHALLCCARPANPSLVLDA